MSRGCSEIPLLISTFTLFDSTVAVLQKKSRWEGNMRVRSDSDDGKLRLRAIAGTRVVLLALDLPETDTKGLKGFAFRRRVTGGSWRWLTGLKVFIDLLPGGVPVGSGKRSHASRPTSTRYRASCGATTRPRRIRNTSSRSRRCTVRRARWRRAPSPGSRSGLKPRTMGGMASGSTRCDRESGLRGTVRQQAADRRRI